MEICGNTGLYEIYYITKLWTMRRLFYALSIPIDISLQTPHKLPVYQMKGINITIATWAITTGIKLFLQIKILLAIRAIVKV